MSTILGNPATLVARLQQSEDPLHNEAAARILQLEQLCAMMTDSGVILEEDVQELVRPDTWWLADDSEYCYDSLQTGMQDIAEAGTPVEWGRAHTLPNCYAVWFEEIKDSAGRVVFPEKTVEYETYQQAEEAAAEYNLHRKRAEYRM